MHAWPLVAGAFGLAACLPGCSSPPPPPPPTVVNLTLVTAADANATADGTGAPLALRVYQLAAAANFNAAEFFPLYNADGTALKADLVHRDDFLLPPGQTKKLTLSPTEAVKSVAVFAAYRDFQHVMWRAATDIEAHKTTNITVTAGHDGLTLKAETPPPPKPAS